MLKWEYKAIHWSVKELWNEDKAEKELNRLGAQGWELVSLVIGEIGPGSILTGKTSLVTMILKKPTE